MVFGLPSGVGAGSTEYFVNRPILETVDPRYLLAFFKTDAFLNNGETQMTGSVGHKRVPKEYLLESRIPLAPLNEQKRIADKLDAVLARVDACRNRLDRIPAILKRFRQSVLAAATSGNLTQEWREENGVSKQWSISTIGELGFVTKLAGFEYTKFVKYRNGGDLKVIKAENAGKWGFKYTDFSTVYSKDVSMLTRSVLKEGDMLMVFVGAGTGQVATVPAGNKWFLGPNIAMVRTNPEILSSAYLEHYCRSPNGCDEISKFIKSVAQRSLSMKTIRQVILPLPPIEEQIEIVRRVESLFAYADRLEARYNAARTQVEKLTPSLLAKAFRGELVPQDPNDEPASELLARITAARSTDKPVKTRQSSRAKTTPSSQTG
jgi:type I restriction enzyme S subunit